MDSKTLKGFIDQQNRRGIGVTPELMEHYEDVKYKELPWYKKLFTESPASIREHEHDLRQFLKHIPEYLEENSKL